MKKLIFILLFMFTFVTLITSIDNGKIKAEELGGKNKIKNTPTYYDNDDPIALTNNFASYYFYNLDENFGNNLVGSCGYVAMAMLLSYYDTYWDDNMIEDRFDENENLINYNLSNTTSSPGIKKDNPTVTYPNVDYYSELIRLSNEINNCFHPYLICYAETTLNYYKEKNTYPCMMLANDFIPLLSKYLYENRNYSQSDIIIESFSEGDILDDFVIPRVKVGIPVVLYMLSTDGFHYVIAYDYNEDLDAVYCHFGWHEYFEDGKICYFNHIRLSSASNYFSYWSAFALDINTTHNCSNNYLDITSEETYCPCYFNLHPSHTHSYVSYTNFNKLKHSGLCYCGTSNFLPHIVREGGSICILCGGTVETGLSTFARNIFTNPMNSIIWTNSYVLYNGVIVISNEDYVKLLNNEIQVPIWEEQ